MKRPAGFNSSDSDAPLPLRRLPRRGEISRYSRIVARARWILPLLAAIPIAIIAAWPYLSSGIARMATGLAASSLGQVADLKMVNPRYAGTDRNDRPFSVTADNAFQTKGNDDLMALEHPRATLRTQTGTTIAVSGDTGVYQAQARYLDLSGNVSVLHDKGYEFHTNSARFSFDDGSAEGDEKVVGSGPSIHIVSDGFRALHNGDSVLFTGHAQLDMSSAGPGQK